MKYYVLPVGVLPPAPSRITLDSGSWRHAEGVTGDECNWPSCETRFVRGVPIFALNVEPYGYICKPCADAAMSPPTCDYPTYPTRATAARHMVNGSTIHCVPTADETNAFHEREQGRFDSGEYTPTPWARDADYHLANHYVHMSLKTPGHISYTKDIEAGILDKQTTVKPGKYLAEFYTDRFTTAQIAKYVAACAVFATSTYSLASTAEDVTRIYNTASGPDSCMRRKTRPEYAWQKLLASDDLPCHPCATYAAGDLAVAYIGPLGHISQRAVVWPDKRQYTRVYGTGPLEGLLKRDGYTQIPTLEGARLQAIPFRDGFVIPYFDSWSIPGHDRIEVYADVHPPYLVITTDTDGLALNTLNGHSCEDEPEPDAETYACANCGEECDDGDTYCSSCSDDHWSCACCGHDFFSMGSFNRQPNDDVWCDMCVSEHTVTCANDDCGHDWIEKVEFSYRERVNRQHAGLTDYCRECADSRLAASEDEVEPEVTPTPDTNNTESLPVVNPATLTTNPLGDTSMAAAIRGAFWAIASEQGVCRVTSCHAIIAPHTRFLSPFGGNGYCLACATPLLREYRGSASLVTEVHHAAV